MRITVPRVDLPVGTAAAWAGLHDVPAGHYELQLVAPRPAAGTMTVRAAFSRDPLQVLALSRQSIHTWQLDLPVGTGDLRFVPDEALATSGGVLRLQPRALAPGPFVPARARLAVQNGHVFVLGGAPFVEGEALWVRGRGAADLVLTAGGSGPGSIAIRLSNGPVPNSVELEVAGETHQLDFGPWGQREVPVEVPGGDAVPVRILSSGGFRPADDGESRDERYLGVRVEFGGAPVDAPPD
jgi:hypothetical protein